MALHNRTKSDDERLLAAISKIILSQNTDAAAEIKETIGIPPNATQYTEPAAEVTTAEIYANNNTDMMIQSKPDDSNTSTIDQSTTLPAAATETADLDYMSNYPNLLTTTSPSDETIAERMLQKQKIHRSQSKTLAVEEGKLASQEKKIVPWRVARIKRDQAASKATFKTSTAPENATNTLGLSRVEARKQQSAYTAATMNQNSKNTTNECSRGNALGLSRAKTIKQQIEYRAATSQQNDAHGGEQVGRVFTPGMVADCNSVSASSDLIARPGVVMFIANNDVELGTHSHSGTNNDEDSILHAVMVEVPSDDEESRTRLLLAEDARALVPVYKQPRVWFVGAVFLGTIVALIFILPSTGNQPIVMPAPTPSMASMSHMPSSSFEPSIFPSFIPSETQPPSDLPSQRPTVSQRPTLSPSVSMNPSQLPSYLPSQQPSVSVQPTTSQYKMQRRGALMALYDETNGDTWQYNSKWLSDAPICDWYGIICNSNDDILQIYLNGNNLQGTIPSEVGLLVDLQVLALADNAISGSIPLELGLLSNLQYLTLFRNSITGIIPSEFGLLIKLENLSLFDNMLTGRVPSELGLLKDLVVFDLFFNSLSGSIPSELGLLTNLEVIGMFRNSLTGNVPLELGLLTNLQYLNLDGSSLTGSIPSELGYMINLEYLSLDSNLLTGSIPSEFGLLTNLEYLSLYDNSLTGSIPSELGILTNLEAVGLFLNSLIGTVPDEICELRNASASNLEKLWADCEEVECPCCTECCVDGGGCSSTLNEINY